MNTGSHARPPGPPPDERRRGLRGPGWTWGTPLVGLLCGSLFVVSWANSEGTDLRPGRYTDLASLVRAESEQYETLQRQVTELDEEVAALTSNVKDRNVNRYQRQIRQLRDPAGLVERIGPGVTVTLTDAPDDVVAAADPDEIDLNDLLVHQQDIQAVVNAMWKGGATAVTVQGKRIISTTGIKCIGNSVTLQGRPYSPPYVISAVGSPDELISEIYTDDYLDLYREAADRPDIAVGWELETKDRVKAPAYDGLLDLSYARPMA